MQKYMDYMKDKGLPGTKVNPAIGPLGDWLAPEETDLLLYGMHSIIKKPI